MVRFEHLSIFVEAYKLQVEVEEQVHAQKFSKRHQSAVWNGVEEPHVSGYCDRSLLAELGRLR